MNNQNNNTAAQSDAITENRPVIFEIGDIAGLFFNDAGVNELLKNDLLQIAEVITIDNHRANIIIGLSILTSEYFELRFVITTTRGIERLSIYETVEKLESFHLKKWMYIVLCDEGRKFSLIDSIPENYSFDGNHFLA